MVNSVSGMPEINAIAAVLQIAFVLSENFVF